MREIKFTQEQLNTMKKMYTEQGFSQEKIGKYFNVSKNTIAKNLKKMNINKLNSKIFVSEKIKDIIIDNYVNKHQGLGSAGKEFGLSQKVVETILKQRGVKKRSYTESKQVSRKYSVNDNYFKYQTSNMAYILGFLAADGCVSSKENGIFI